MTTSIAFAASCGLIVASFATVSLFAGLLSAGLLGLATTVAYVRGGTDEPPADGAAETLL